ncbi:reverse transcriptase domain-containing protein, partial [Clostridioides difficile]|uniref:reverse transcriptase domain-containing protein n=1 Tax=Clostridioides difficile TaxID=1496 RepID=UPI0013EF609E
KIACHQKNILDQKQFGLFISLDISGAFDSAWWALILHKLRLNQVPGNIYRVVAQYFDNRRCSLPLCGLLFGKQQNRGCPQGAKTSPLFWNLIYDDILRIEFPPGCHLQAFADDAFLVCQDDRVERVVELANRSLQLIYEWGTSNKLLFNPTKTQAMLVTRRRRIDCEIEIFMNGTQVSTVDRIKYLGVVFDPKMLWNKHVDYVASRSITLFRQLSRTFGRQWGIKGHLIRLMYLGAVEPVISYACSAWLDALQKQYICKKLLKAQRLFALAIIRAYKSVSTEAALLLANITPIDLKLPLVASRYKIKKGNIPAVLGQLQYEDPCHFLANGHPAIESKFVGDCSIQHQIEIYTDGSKISNRTGCAFVVFQNNEVQYHNKTRLADACTVFQAEMLAIKQAVSWASSSCVDQSVAI